MSVDPYIRRCEVLRVIDGDTLDLRIDLGYHATITERIRLLGADTPELRSPDPAERTAAQEARVFTATWLAGTGTIDDDILSIRSEKDDSFGRWLGEMRRADRDETLTEALIGAGLATEWPTRWRDVYGVTA